ncbi:hypothetical protein U1Q18_012291 [Sarracenia purpurea var. burkii]
MISSPRDLKTINHFVSGVVMSQIKAMLNDVQPLLAEIHSSEHPPPPPPPSFRASTRISDNCQESYRSPTQLPPSLSKNEYRPNSEQNLEERISSKFETKLSENRGIVRLRSKIRVF